MALPELPPLSPQQEALLGDAAQVGEAGPGSGKTRALVARFVHRASTSNRGVALLSFTNAAVDEARSRCAASPQLLHAPNFVGTIDSFLHRFIVTPFETQRLHRLPSYRRSWDELPESYSTVRLNGINGAGIPLSAFHLDTAGNLTLSSQLGWEATAYRIQVENAGRMSNLLTRAKASISGLNKAGVYDAATARVKALQLLSRPSGGAILDRLALRFTEILVDEAQDCDEAEFNIVRLVRNRGVTTVLVADPDQAIFEFRGGNPDLFLAFSAECADEAKVELSTNFRSTKEICNAVAVLRAAGSATIIAHDQGACCPVFVLAGTPQEQGVKFRQVIEELGIPTNSAIVVAHARGDAVAPTGGGPSAGTSTAAGNRLAVACAQLRAGYGDAATRLAAVKAIEEIILSLLDWPQEIRPMGRDAKLIQLDRRSEWLRQAAGAMAANLCDIASKDDFGTRSRQIMKRVLQPLAFPMVEVSQRLKKPTDGVWEQCNAVWDQPGVLASDTIHGVKGGEAAAVLVALPDTLRKIKGKDVLDNIEEGNNTEARRVLYVGASRAKDVLAFGAGRHAARLAAILGTSGVAVEIR